jgi:hypothetical protein
MEQFDFSDLIQFLCKHKPKHIASTHYSNKRQVNRHSLSMTYIFQKAKEDEEKEKMWLLSFCFFIFLCGTGV